MKKLSLALFLALAVVAARAGETVNYNDIAALQTVLPQQSQDYTIDPVVEVQEPYYVFRVSSPHHPLYTVTGIGNLIKLCHEITMMEWFYTTETGSQVWVGVKDSVKTTAAGAKQLVLHPGASFQGMKRSVKRTGRSIKDMVTGIGKDKKSSDGKNLEQGAGNLLTSDTARKVAYELHLDAYTQNVWVRKLIENIALRRSAGGAAVSVATTLTVPMTTLVSVSSSFAINGALTPGAYLEQVEVLLRDNPPGELYRELAKHMMNIGIQKDSKELLLFQAFTQNPNYTPHDKAYMTSFLVKLSDVAGMGEVLQTLSTTPNTHEASILFNQLQFLSAFNKQRFNLTRFVVNEDNVFAKDNADVLIAILPFDTVDRGEGMEDTLGFIKTTPAASRSVWVIGTAKPNFRNKLQQHGVNQLRENIIRYNPNAQTKR